MHSQFNKMSITEINIFRSIASNPPKGLSITQIVGDIQEQRANDIFELASNFWTGFVTFLNKEVQKCHVVNVKGFGKFYLHPAAGQFLPKYVAREPVTFTPSSALSSICAGALIIQNIPNVPGYTVEMRHHHVAQCCSVSESDCKVLMDTFLLNLSSFVESGSAVVIHIGEVGSLALSKRNLTFTPGLFKPSVLAYNLPSSIPSTPRNEAAFSSRRASSRPMTTRNWTSQFSSPSMNTTTNVMKNLIASDIQLNNGNNSVSLNFTTSLNKNSNTLMDSTASTIQTSKIPALDLKTVSGYTGTVPHSARAHLLLQSDMVSPNSQNIVPSISQSARVRTNPAIESLTGYSRTDNYYFTSSKGLALPWVNLKEYSNRDLEKKLYKRMKGCGVEVNSCNPSDYNNANFKFIEEKKRMKQIQHMQTMQQDEVTLSNTKRSILEEFDQIEAKRNLLVEMGREHKQASLESAAALAVPFHARFASLRETNGRELYALAHPTAPGNVLETPDQNSFFPFQGSDNAQKHTQQLNQERKSEYRKLQSEFKLNEGINGIFFASPARKGMSTIPINKTYSSDEQKKRLEALCGADLWDSRVKKFNRLSTRVHD